MRFDFTDDQKTFHRHVRDMLKRECTVDTVRAAWESDTGRVDGLWKTLMDAGLGGLLVDESLGGLGLTELDFVLLLEAAGEFALPEPLSDHAMVAVPLLASTSNEAVRDTWLEAAISGDALLTTDLYGAGFVPAANSADAFIVEQEGKILLVDADATEQTAQQSVDRSRKLATLSFNSNDADVIADGEEAERLLFEAHQRGALAAAAELSGLARSVMELGVEYAKVREQFGKAIGTFQAVQHRIVNGYLKEQFARPAVYRAAYAVANDESDMALHVSMAKALASEAADRVCREILQIHGGIGYTTEYELHLWMKRAWALQAAWGDARTHRRSLEKTLLGEAPSTN
jgi:alkylation response protein AidB-like acyl-CoA dehydrogenase